MFIGSVITHSVAIKF